MTNQPEMDSALIRLAADGTNELSRLFELQRDNLRHLITRRIVGQLAARFDASDVIQETFIRACRQLEKYVQAPNVHPVVWLRMLCKQLLSETIRKNMRGRRTPLIEAHSVGEEMLAESLVDSVHSVSDNLVRQEALQKLKLVLGSIDKTDQEIIEMRHAEDMTFVQIAQFFEAEMETVKKRYYRALDEIRNGIL